MLSANYKKVLDECTENITATNTVEKPPITEEEIEHIENTKKKLAEIIDIMKNTTCDYDNVEQTNKDLDNAKARIIAMNKDFNKC